MKSASNQDEQQGNNECNPAPPRVRLVTVEQMPVGPNSTQALCACDAADFARNLIGSKDREHFLVLHLDARRNIVSHEVASVGTLNATMVHPREIFKGALLANAADIICVHNHPAESTDPSTQDLRVLGTLKESGEILCVALLDFIIVTATSYWAASESHPGLLGQ